MDYPWEGNKTEGARLAPQKRGPSCPTLKCVGQDGPPDNFYHLHNHLSKYEAEHMFIDIYSLDFASMQIIGYP